MEKLLLQVESINALLELPSDRMAEIKDTLRMDVINHTINLDKRLSKLYDLIENELLGPLVCSSNYISSYKVCPLAWNGCLHKTATISACLPIVLCVQKVNAGENVLRPPFWPVGQEQSLVLLILHEIICSINNSCS